MNRIFSRGHFKLIYKVFNNDSLPALDFSNTSMASMINGFDIDIQRKKILHARIGESGQITFTNIQALSDSAMRSTTFRNYILNHKGRLHPKFIYLLPASLLTK